MAPRPRGRWRLVVRPGVRRPPRVCLWACATPASPGRRLGRRLQHLLPALRLSRAREPRSGACDLQPPHNPSFRWSAWPPWSAARRPWRQRRQPQSPRRAWRFRRQVDPGKFPMSMPRKRRGGSPGSAQDRSHPAANTTARLAQVPPAAPGRPVRNDGSLHHIWQLRGVSTRRPGGSECVRSR